MDIRDAWCSRATREKLLDKHSVDWPEVREVFRNGPYYAKLGRDDWGDLRYAAVGRTDAGRLLKVVFVCEPPFTAHVITARDAERRNGLRRR